ncbi:MAG: SDR family oxidoreductase [Deltaproteobacteria bacterium]|nr:SDR family oxidoreductase [Deltaproteobacteria bacterium]
MPRTVILGAAGFIGSHLVDRFLERGHEVIGVDNFITGSPDNLAHHEGNERFTFLEHDITRFIEIDGPVDFILNFASPASPIDYLELPIQTLKVGALGTHNALGLAVAKKARFLQASTSEVYGDPLEHPQKESYLGNVDTIGPRGVYDEGKRFGEALVMAYHRTHGLETRIDRIFNTYGPRMRLGDGRVVPAFISQVLADKPLTVFGDGRQTRSFCYIEDQVDGIERLLYSSEVLPVNIGNPEEHSMLSLAETLQSIASTRLPLVYSELPTGDPKVRCPDITRAKQVLGWEPKVPLIEGLSRTLDYYRERSRSNA